MDALTRLALSRYPEPCRRDLELLWYAIRRRHDSPVKQLRAFDRLVRRKLAASPPLG